MSPSRRFPLLSRTTPLVVPVVLVAALELVVFTGWIPTSQYVAPHQVLEAAWSGEIFNDLGWTCMRLLCGVALGTVAGMVSGFALSQFRALDRLFSHTLRGLAAIPIIIWLPFLSRQTGLGETTKICFVAIATFFLVHMHCYHSAREEDNSYTELTQIYESSLWQRLTYVVVPASYGEILTAIRLAVALGWVVVAYAEFSIQDGNHNGIGQYILQNKTDGRIEQMFAGMLLLAIAGTVIDVALAIAEQRLRSWADDSMHHDEKWTSDQRT